MPPFTAATLLLAGGSLLAVAQDTRPALMAVRSATRETSAAGPQYDIGYIDLKKGFISTGQLLLPAPYTMLVPGTMGQSSTMFVQNRTWYLLATSGGGSGVISTEHLAALAVRYYSAGSTPTPVRATVAAEFNRTRGEAKGSGAVNLAWDDTCNIIVTAPTRGQDGTITFETLMVSEYDGQVRPQVPLFSEPEAGVAAWRRVEGLGAMDVFGESTGGPLAWNCGDECALLTLEEYGYGDHGHGDDDDEFTAMPRRLVGRRFHTGAVASNVTAAHGLLTLSAVGSPAWEARLQAAIHPERAPPTPQHAPFVGLGVCPATSAANGACGEPGALVLLGYTTGLSTHGPEVLVQFRGGKALSPAAVDEAVGLGVVVRESWDAASARGALVAHVWLAGTVVTFDLTIDESTAAGVKATLNETATVPGPAPAFWQQYGG